MEYPIRSPESAPSVSRKPRSARTVVPGSTQRGSGRVTSVPGAPAGAPPGSIRAWTGVPSTAAFVIVDEVPSAAVAGRFGQFRNTTSQTRSSGVNRTDSVPVAEARSGARSSDASTAGRCGHGSARPDRSTRSTAGAPAPHPARRASRTTTPVRTRRCAPSLDMIATVVGALADGDRRAGAGAVS